jgi:hypothetical protein
MKTGVAQRYRYLNLLARARASVIDDGKNGTLSIQPRRPAPWHGGFVSTASLNPESYRADDSLRPSIVCSLCEIMRSWMQSNAAILSEPGGQFSHAFHHHVTGWDLEASCQRGCHPCTLIWLNFTQESRRKYPSTIYQEYVEFLRNSRHLRILYSQCNLSLFFQEQPSDKFNRYNQGLRLYSADPGESLRSLKSKTARYS